MAARGGARPGNGEAMGAAVTGGNPRPVASVLTAVEITGAPASELATDHSGT